MGKETKEELLKGQIKKYNDINRNLGNDVFKKVVPRKVKKADIENLKEEGRYQDIYAKYGDKALKKVLIDAEYDERKMSQGVLKARIWKLKTKFFKNIFI